jgi:hypothetical protein
MPGKSEKVKTEIVGVDKIAQLFGKSEREVQRLVIFDGMPRINRGQYDLVKCAEWYVAYLHAQVCGCMGPCDGFDAESRNSTNPRAERTAALAEIANLAPELVGLKVGEIEKVLANAVEDIYRT